MRQIVLDTETTGLEASQGHRIIEIGCVELVNRRLTGNHYHQYINPEREIDQGAIEVHGITNDFVSSKPLFAAVADEFLDFVRGAQLIIHNAPFDLGFLDAELQRLDDKQPAMADVCTVIDTLVMARGKHPGQRNSLDALCTRYHVDNSQRDLHGALLDAEILADVYLTMTGGQTALQLSDTGDDEDGQARSEKIIRLPAGRAKLPIIEPTEEEVAAHERQLQAIGQSSGGKVIWHSQAAEE